VSPLSLGIAGFWNKINIREFKRGDKDVRKKGKKNEMREERKKKMTFQPYEHTHNNSRTMPCPLILCCWRIWTNLIKSGCYPNLKRHIIWKGSAKDLSIA
jgi:hypothetical protein